MNHRDAEAYIRMVCRRKRAEERRQAQAIADEPRLWDTSDGTWKPTVGLNQVHQAVFVND